MKKLHDKIRKGKLPLHVAIIMDGNGRWAKKKGNKRIFGHRNAVTAVREAIEATAELGIKYLTLYAFSKENWQRPRSEVLGLMSLLVGTLAAETNKLHENNIRLHVIGDIHSLPEKVQNELHNSLEKTCNNKALHLVLALSYGSRWEITEAVKDIAMGVKNKTIAIDAIDEKMISDKLNTAGMPDPELLIRTGGEKRISNFLLWQLSYCELYFTDVLWPDFRKADYYKAVIDFQSRERRFGKTGEQTKKGGK